VEVKKGGTTRNGIPFDCEVLKSQGDPVASNKATAVALTQATANGGKAEVKVTAQNSGTCLLRIHIRPSDHAPYTVDMPVSVNP
jgi:hypothetical protein